MTRLIPENFDLWKMSTIVLNCRVMCVARRHGITLQIVGTDDGWSITKIKGGRVLDTEELHNIPPDAMKAIRNSTPKRIRVTKRDRVKAA